MSRFLVLCGWLLAAGYAVAAAESASAKPAPRPNIVVIVADDLGYNGLSCQGGDISTPRIDSLAGGGIRFTNGYVSCPVCSPTRAGLMTGRYQQRFGHESNPGPLRGSDEFGLPLSEVTIADRLKAAGYTTGMVGKWHLGNSRKYLPPSRGFDEFFGFPGGAHSYLDLQPKGNNPIMRGFEPVPEQEYLTDALSREAVAFVNRHARDTQPFFLYLPYNAVHTPMDTAKKYMERFGHIQDPLRRKHAAMLAAMDDGVGVVMDALRKNSLEEKTLVVFFSDNGGPTRSNTSSNKPLRGYKGQVFEGGIRIPFMAAWKGHLPAGKVDDRPVIQLDIMPTAVALAGGTMPGDRPIDGVNLMPYLTGEKAGLPHEALFWRMGPQAAVRKGDWKLIRREAGPGQAATSVAAAEQERTPKAKRSGRRQRRAATSPPEQGGAVGPDVIGPVGTVKLFNLAKDIHEDHDLAAEHPEKVKELAAALDAWEAQLAQPLWYGKSKFNNAAASQPVKRRANRAMRNRQ